MRASYFVRYAYSVGVNNIERWDAVDIIVLPSTNAMDKMKSISAALVEKDNSLCTKYIDIISVTKI